MYMYCTYIYNYTCTTMPKNYSKILTKLVFTNNFATFLVKVLLLCFKLYSSREPTVHNTANVAIRQVVQTLFDRLNQLANQGGSHTCHVHVHTACMRNNTVCSLGCATCIMYVMKCTLVHAILLCNS